MEAAKCKICFRQFSNRKALGGHMRSHMSKLSIQPNNPPPPPPAPKPDHNTSTGSKFNVFDDQESETDTPAKNLLQSRRRSKRTSTCRSKADSPDSTSVVSDVNDFSAEDAAQVLVLLSMEKWLSNSSNKRRRRRRQQRQLDDHHQDEDDDDFTVVYRCETCNKGFQSYQALGGHRASHKKLRIIDDDSDDEDDDEDREEEEEEEEEEEDAASASAVAPPPTSGNQRTFTCPYCFKVFESGQAMGGHKKVHMSAAAAAARRTISTPVHDFIHLDLNLPAPEEDNGSQVDDPSLK